MLAMGAVIIAIAGGWQLARFMADVETTTTTAAAPPIVTTAAPTSTAPPTTTTTMAPTTTTTVPFARFGDARTVG